MEGEERTEKGMSQLSFTASAVVGSLRTMPSRRDGSHVSKNAQGRLLQRTTKAEHVE